MSATQVLISITTSFLLDIKKAIVSALRSQFNWFQYRTLISITDKDKREYYELEAQENKRRKIQRTIFDVEEKIEDQRDELIKDLKKAKEQTITTDELFTIQWEII